VHGAGEHTIETAQHGAHGGPPSSKHSASDALGFGSFGTHQKAKTPRQGEDGQGAGHAPGYRSTPAADPSESQPTKCGVCGAQLVGAVQLSTQRCGPCLLNSRLADQPPGTWEPLA